MLENELPARYDRCISDTSRFSSCAYAGFGLPAGLSIEWYLEQYGFEGAEDSRDDNVSVIDSIWSYPIWVVYTFCMVHTFSRMFLLVIAVLTISLDAYFLAPSSRFSVTYNPPDVERSFYSSKDGGVFSDPGGQSVSRVITGRINVSELGAFAIGSIAVRVDDCLEEFLIDGKALEGVRLPYCDWGRPLTVSRPPPVAANSEGWSFSATFVNRGGRGRFSVSVMEAWWLQAARIMGYTALVLLIVGLCNGAKSSGFVAPLAVGVILRLIYFYYGDVYARSHDLDGHLEYINYLLSHWSVPNPAAGWEFHQGPIFYFLAAAVITAVKVCTGLEVSPLLAGQFVALICSLIALVFALKLLVVVETALSEASHSNLDLGGSRDLLLSIGVSSVMMIVATHPNFIFCTMRMSNDALIFAIISYIVYRCALQIVACKETPLVVSIASTLLAFLTKTNGLIGIVLWYCADLLTLSRRRAVKRCASLALSLAVIGGGYAAYRCYQSQGIGLFYRSHNNLHSGLAVQNNLGNFLSFNPLRIVRDVYNDNWSEAKHRSFFWEYLSKSVVFGEFNHGPQALNLARLMLVLTLSIVTLVVIALISQRIPLSRIFIFSLVGIVSSLVMLLTFRLRHPFSCHQEARLIPALFPLAALMLTVAVDALSVRLSGLKSEMRQAAACLLYCILFSLPVVQVAFLLSIL